MNLKTILLKAWVILLSPLIFIMALSALVLVKLATSVLRMVSSPSSNS